MSGVITFFGECALAQITPDGTLPNNSIVTPQGDTNLIEGGTQAGSNLFHSFEQFSVPTGGEAFFNNAMDIQNIISRVTGGSISNIHGLLRANGTANLFLLNPNGIIFGPNATLNIGGSFVGSTASAVNFADGTQFSATAPTTTPLLTVSVPLGLQYGANPGMIQVQGDGQGTRTTTDLIDTTVGLRVQQNQTLAIVGGDIALSGGTLKTAGGRIELGSVASPGVVNLTPTNTGWALGYEGVPTFGDIQLSGTATVDASGAGGGDIQVQGRRVTLTNGSRIVANTLGAEPGGTLSVRSSDVVEVIGTSANGKLGSGLFADTRGDGNAGDLTITTGRLNVRDGAQLGAGTFGTGAGGTLSVTASDVVDVIGISVNGEFGSGLFTQTSGDGNAGDLTITTGQLNVRDGAQLGAGTFGSGAGGTLSVTASDVVEVIGRTNDGKVASGLFTQTSGDGNAGDLRIVTGRLTVRDGASVSAGTFGSGAGGTLSVTASNVVEVIGTGTSADGQFISGLFADTEGDGNAGDLTIVTGRLNVRDGAQVSTRTTGTGAGGTLSVTASDVVEVIGTSDDGRVSSGLYAQTEGSGNAGNLTIVTGRLTVRDGAQVSASTTGTGAGGTLSVTASDVVEVIGTSDDGPVSSGLYAATQGDGNAGDLRIVTRQLNVRDGAQVSASTTGTGAGGTLSVTASDVVEVIGTSDDGRAASGLYALTQGNGNAGNLTIVTGQLNVRDGAQVSASTTGTGAGGTLSVTASDVVEVIGTSANGRLASGLYAATQGDGNAGNLTIATRRLNVRNGAQVAVRSLGSGNAGLLRVKAGSVLLENQGRLLASTASGEGGNIELQVQDSILMRRNSLISAQAGGIGNGGNITINTPFIVAVPSENSDIFANAILGRGGNIFITTQGIYGLEYRSNQTSESDINASSQFGVSGTVEINNPDVDPTQGLVELPAELVDASNSFATGCSAGGKNEFIITGRGGLPPNPYEPLDSSEVWRDVQLPRELAESDGVSRTSTSPTISPGRIVEAQGWIVNKNGNVELVAKVPTAISQYPCDLRSSTKIVNTD